LTLTWTDAAVMTGVTTNLASLGVYAGLERLTPDFLRTNLGGFADWASGLNSLTWIGTPLPVVGAQLPATLDLPGLLRSRLVTNVQPYQSAQSLATQL